MCRRRRTAQRERARITRRFISLAEPFGVLRIAFVSRDLHLLGFSEMQVHMQRCLRICSRGSSGSTAERSPA